MIKFLNVVWRGIKSKLSQVIVLLIVGFLSGTIMSAKKYLTIPAQIDKVEQCTGDLIEQIEGLSTKDELNVHIEKAKLINDIQDAEIKANRELMKSIERQNKETIRLLQQIYENVR